MGIRHEFKSRYTPEQNGVVERKNRSFVEAARAMLEEKSLPKFYWAEAVQTAVYIQNWIGEKVLAHELCFGRKPNLLHLRVFGSIAYVHVPKEKQRKLDAKAEKCILVGYVDEQKGYKYYNPRTKLKERYRDKIEKMRKRLHCYNIILLRQYKRTILQIQPQNRRTSWFLIAQTHKFLSLFYLHLFPPSTILPPH